MAKPKVVWAPFPGSQRKFMTCPAWECLLHGNRGGGKTDVLLMDYAQGVGRGYGEDYRGLLLREATTELGDVIAKSKKWFTKMFPGAKYNKSRKIWEFPGGETLWLNYARVEDDYEQYHGHEYPWIGWEELTNQPVPDVYLKLMSCNRTSNPDIPKKYRATCNPSGPGHAWVKRRFIDAVAEGEIIKEDIPVTLEDDEGNEYEEILQVTRTHVQSSLDENKAMMKADPLYRAKIIQMTEGNDMLRKAWLHGDWNLVIGGFFTDVWNPNIHILTPFDMPKSWDAFRSFDWGSSKPWCVTYLVEADGTQPEDVFGDPILPFHVPRGSHFIIAEIYGWTGVPNEGDRATSSQIAERVKMMDHAIHTEYGLKVSPGPADNQIWEVRDGTSIAKNMAAKPNYLRWKRSYKGPGSRIAGWSLMRSMLFAALNRSIESPHLYYFSTASNHIRVLPEMQRDTKKPEDIDSDLEDHPMDSTRYGLTRKMLKFKRKKVGI